MNYDNILKILDRYTAPMRRRISLMVSRAVVATVDDSTKRQLMQVTALAGEILEDVERFQNFGFTAVPLPGSEAVIVFAQGNRDHPLIVGCDDKNFRKKGLAAGEAAIHGVLPEARFIHIKNDGTILIQTDGNVQLNTPQVKLGPDILAEPVIKGTTFQTIYNSHTHISNLPGFINTPPVIPLTGTELSLVTTTD